MCPRIVRLALARLDGVDHVKVSFGKQRAWVVYEPEKVTVRQMLDAVKRAGFGVEVVPQEDS